MNQPYRSVIAGLGQALELGPEKQGRKVEKGLGVTVGQHVLSGVSNVYNQYIQNSAQMYAAEVEQRARYATSGEEFVKSVSDTITPKYKNHLLFSQAHGRVADKVGLLGQEIDFQQEKKIKDLEASSLMHSLSGLMNMSANYIEYEQKAKSMVDQYTAQNGDLNAVANKNYQLQLQTAKSSFAYNEQRQAKEIYFNNALSAFAKDPDQHQSAKGFIGFINNEISEPLGNDTYYQKQALKKAMEYVPTVAMGQEIINHFSNSLNDLEKQSLQAIARTTENNMRYQARKNLDSMRMQLQASIDNGLAATDPDVVGLMTDYQKKLNDFALKENLSQRSPNDLLAMYQALAVESFQTTEKLKPYIPGVASLEAKQARGDMNLTPEEIFAAQTLSQIEEITGKTSYLSRMRDKFYRDFANDFVEAIENRNPGVKIPSLVIPVQGEKGELLYRDEFMQSLIGRKSLYDAFKDKYQGTNAIQHMFSNEDLNSLNQLFAKLDPMDGFNLAESISRIVGVDDANIIKATSNDILAQAIEMNKTGGTDVPPGTIYGALETFRRKDPKKYSEHLTIVNDKLNSITAGGGVLLDSSYMDTELRKKLIWYNTGLAALNGTDKVGDIVDQTVQAYQAGSKYYSDISDYNVYLPPLQATSKATKRIGSYFLNKNDFLLFKQAIRPYQNIIQTNPKATWQNLGSSTKTFVMVELGDDNIVRPLLNKQGESYRIDLP
jgi:hypothetical protein